MKVNFEVHIHGRQPLVSPRTKTLNSVAIVELHNLVLCVIVNLGCSVHSARPTVCLQVCQATNRDRGSVANTRQVSDSPEHTNILMSF